jgi:hypothetical protein
MVLMRLKAIVLIFSWLLESWRWRVGPCEDLPASRDPKGLVSLSVTWAGTFWDGSDSPAPSHQGRLGQAGSQAQESLSLLEFLACPSYTSDPERWRGAWVSV